jgi:hypothetical protein
VTAAAVTDRRRQLLQDQSALNGIDRVEVVAGTNGSPARLRVTFVNPLATMPRPEQVQVGGGVRIQTIEIVAVDATDDPRTVLATLARSGDLSQYELRIVRSATDTQPPAWVDPVLARGCFSFALGCVTGLPCDAEPACPPAALEEPGLDYLARDFESLRAVLLDRMSVLQPAWTERNAADVRMLLVELLAELGDRLSYRQDTITTEAYLGTARQRISVRRHARLVDYTMSDGTNARAWVQICVPAGVVVPPGGPSGTDIVPIGTRLLTGGPDAPAVIAAGSEEEAAARRAGAAEFSTMSGLAVVDGAHSEMAFYTWSGSRPMLPASATSATLAGHRPRLAVGQVLILVERRNPSQPERPEDADRTRRQAVRLTKVVAFDSGGPLRDPLTGNTITEIAWDPGDALAFPLTIAGEIRDVAGTPQEYADGAVALGNIVLADHGGPAEPEDLPAVPDSGPVRFRLPRSPLTQVPLFPSKTKLAHQARSRQLPGDLVEFDPNGSAASAIGGVPDVVLPHVGLHDPGGPWTVRRDLISSDGARAAVVEVDDEGFGWLRFGRGSRTSLVDGARPAAGTVIQASYRVGNGTVGNVGAGSIRTLLDDGAMLEVVNKAGRDIRISNPLPACGGTDPETIEEVRQRAPFAFRQQERTVTAEDYARRAEQYRPAGLPVIQRAVATIRWTGSWYVVVVAIDPMGGTPADDLLAGLQQYLDRYRMAGHDLQVVPADYAALEVGLAIVVDPDHRRDLVRAELLSVMSNRRLPNGRLGIFHPDRLTFGESVYLGPILAAAQAIPGVSRVEATRFSRYRLPATDARPTGRIDIGAHEIPLLDNDPSRPERGRFVLDRLKGGR